MSYLPVTNSSPIEKSLTFLDEVKLEEKICKKNIITEDKTLIESPFNNYILEQRQVGSFFNWLLDDISVTIDCKNFLNKKHCLKQDSVLEEEDLHKIYKNFKHIICFRNFSLEKFIYKLKYEIKYQTASYSYSLENNINYFADSYLKNPVTHIQEPLETILNSLLFVNLNSSNIHFKKGLYLKKMSTEDNFIIEEKIKQILNINSNTIQKIDINQLVQKIINHPCILTNHKKGMLDLLNIESEKKNNTNNNFLPISISRCKPFLHMPIECRLLERVILAQFMDTINISNINNNNKKFDKEVCYKVCISSIMGSNNNVMLKFPVWLITTLYNFINKIVVEESVLKFMKFFFYQLLSGGNLVYMLPNAEVYRRTSHLNKKKKKKKSKSKEKGKDECLDLLDSDCHRILKKLCLFYIIMLVLIKESESINESKEMEEKDKDITEESYSDIYNTTVFSHFENEKQDNSKEKINKNNPLDIYLKNIFTDINGNFHIILKKDMPSFKDSLLRNLQSLVVDDNNFDKTNEKENIITIERIQ